METSHKLNEDKRFHSKSSLQMENISYLKDLLLPEDFLIEVDLKDDT